VAHGWVPVAGTGLDCLAVSCAFRPLVAPLKASGGAPPESAGSTPETEGAPLACLHGRIEGAVACPGPCLRF